MSGLNKFVDDIKSGVKGFHGAGEAIRGTFNENVDRLVPNAQSSESEAKNHAIAQKGLQDMKNTDERVGSHNGIATGGVSSTGVPETTTTTTGTTAAGAHSAPIGTAGNAPTLPPRQDVNTAQENPATTERY